MIDKFQQVIPAIASKPKSLFIIDGLGAILSAFFLGLILTRFEVFFGMPKQVLYFLALLPFLFAVYDCICFFKIKSNCKPFILIIAIANLIYCCISVTLVWQHFHLLTALGLIYFINECIILFVIVSIELKVAKRLFTRPSLK